MNTSNPVSPLVNEEAIARIVRDVPVITQMPTMDEMNARTRALAASGLAQVRTLGTSRMGEAIELISIGSGPRSVVLVGTPHPNETIGCLTIEYLIDRLTSDPKLRDALGRDWTWHFIKCIEPDGLRLNEGWLATPYDVAAYIRNVFRPAAAEQAEYSFPLNAHGYKFDACTPENQAWQLAFALTEPELLLSLHNCEHGGCYYAVSREFPVLTELLATHPAACGMPVITQEEGFGDEGSLAPGVYGSFDIEELLKDWSLQANPGPAPWDAGQSSFGYTAAAGTFGLIVETPHWVEARNDWEGSPDVPLKAIHSQAAIWFGDTVTLVDRHLDNLLEAPDPRAPRLIAAVRDFRNSAESTIQSLRRDTHTVLSPHDAAMQLRITRLRQLRPIGMLSRLAGWAFEQQSEARAVQLAVKETSAYLDAALKEPLLTQGMRSMPFEISVGLQVKAILTAMSCLS